MKNHLINIHIHKQASVALLNLLLRERHSHLHYKTKEEPHILRKHMRNIYIHIILHHGQNPNDTKLYLY